MAEEQLVAVRAELVSMQAAKEAAEAATAAALAGCQEAVQDAAEAAAPAVTQAEKGLAPPPEAAQLGAATRWQSGVGTTHCERHEDCVKGYRHSARHAILTPGYRALTLPGEAVVTAVILVRYNGDIALIRLPYRRAASFAPGP